MNIVFFIINCHSDKELLDFIQSINNAKKDGVNIQLNVLDNSQKNKIELSKLDNKLNKIFKTNLQTTNKNLGYFGCLSIAQKQINNEDCVIYCNADLQIEKDFFIQLHDFVKTNPKEIIAPAIVTIDSGTHLNPQLIERIQKKRMLFYKKIYRHLITFTLYSFLGHIKELLFKSQPKNIIKQTIYAPHGAMFIFTDIEFFKNLPPYPCFLFGEELFIAEEARLKKVSIIYEPSIKVRDVRHASIGALSNEFKRSLCHKSICYILDKYYR